MDIKERTHVGQRVREELNIIPICPLYLAIIKVADRAPTARLHLEKGVLGECTICIDVVCVDVRMRIFVAHLLTYDFITNFSSMFRSSTVHPSAAFNPEITLVCPVLGYNGV